ncbi:MAG: hypothetical protein J3R72DRAFT_521151 [Linnemannia gamsii]|nr:MAG: hypothetical protein J3R72DRAFT_521151 [Linnemannia gamsii]
MSSTFPLPLECLQLIIRHLLSQVDQKSVAVLLCVNKYVCAATLPILYSDPFDMPPLSSRNADFVKDEEILLAVTRLIQVLLRSLSPASTTDQDGQGLVTELLRGMYFPHGQYEQQDREAPPLDTARQENLPVPETAITTTTTTPLPLSPTFLPYASYITRITFEDFGYDRERFCFTLGGYEDQLNFQDFLNRTGRVDQYRTEEPRPHYLWNNSGEKEFMKRTVERLIRRDLTWAMCYPKAEQIQTLHLPLSDVDRYLTLIPRFKILSEATFHLDRTLSVPSELNVRMTPKEEEVLASLKEDRSRNLEQMILFVQEHRRHHPHVISTARCSNSRFFVHHCPREYHIRLLQSLPPLVRPLFLHDRNWDQFATHISETDLAHVRTLRSRRDPVVTKRLDSLLKQDPFLNRCRSLEDISFRSSSENMFQWAVKERKEFDGAGLRNGTFRRPLVPLQSYHVLFDNPSSGRQASDVVYAFGETLKSIEIIFGGGVPLVNDSSQHLPEFSLGACIDGLEDVNGAEGLGTSSWLQFSRIHLPRLESILVNARYRCLRLHPAFLARSPRLKSVILADTCSRYSLADVVYWDPAELPHLDHLSLSGTPVISFHPDTFKSTKNLVRIEMQILFATPLYMYTVSRNILSFIPNLEDFEQQESENDSNNDYRMSLALPRSQPPVWAWDWDLPSLTTLRLSGDIAYMFQFRMLAGTPNLTYFSIDIDSITGFQQRTVRIADLLKPGFRYPALADFLERDQQLHESRQRLIDYSAEDDEACQQRQREEDADKDGDERLWSEGFEFVHVPKLKMLLLDGWWIMDYRFLKVLFSKVAPQIETLSLGDSRGFTATELVKSTADHLNQLNHCDTRVPYSDRLAADAGLVDKMPELRMDDCVYHLAVPPIGRVVDRPATYLLHREPL